ncbi:ATP-binding protein [Nocardia sp. NPDC050712]|uniref:sensor histidine kinase n=1 Tax=Nocardia sp. NPDC050712 TaxID=3155518 RepID=UPI003401806C
MTAVQNRTRIVGRFSVQTWFQLVLAVMAIVVLIGAAAGAQVIANTNNATDRVMNHTQPALTRAFQLQAALIDQETGIRGYAITGDQQFLDPYRAGQQAQTVAADRIKVLLAGDSKLLAQLDAVQSAAQNWRTGYAAARAADPTPTASGTPAISAQGKTLFDTVRASFEAQNAGLAAVIADDRRALDHARTLRNVVLLAMVAVFLVTGLALTVLIRRLVTRPLAALSKASLKVAGGDFEHSIDAHGPTDVAALGSAVERMRGRIVTELETSRGQEATLVRQKADLDVQTEELRRSNTELEQFAYVASHDLQEPLRKVASFCQLLEKRYGDQLDGRGKQYIDYAVDGAKRMQVLINDLLTFSRVGRVTDSTQRTELGATLDDALANISSAIEGSRADIQRPEQLPQVVGDPTLLTMLWQNLIANAVKFRSPDRPPVIVIDADLNAEAGMWEFAVTDNGIGIAPEFTEQVFVIFQRLHSRESYSGTGIGLAVSKKIVEYHGGKIWIDTAHTDGTRFRFTLPVPVELADAAVTAVEGESQ